MALNITRGAGRAALTEVGLKYLYPEVWNGSSELTDEMIEDALNRVEGMITAATHFSGDTGTINGHYWVERDGKVVDTTLATKGFKQNENARKKRLMCLGSSVGCDMKKLTEGLKNHEYVYVEAPPITQQIMVNASMSPYKKAFNGNMEFAMECLSAIDAYRPYYGCCNMNAVMEQIKNGGVIKFGSLGYKAFGVTDWVYGRDTYKTIKEFRDYLETKDEEREKFEFVCECLVSCDPDEKSFQKFVKHGNDVIDEM